MENKIQIALQAIQSVFADTSVSQQETYEALLELREEIEMFMDSLEV